MKVQMFSPEITKTQHEGKKMDVKQKLYRRQSLYREKHLIHNIILSERLQSRPYVYAPDPLPVASAEGRRVTEKTWELQKRGKGNKEIPNANYRTS